MNQQYKPTGETALIIVPPLISYWRGTKRVQESQRVAGAPTFDALRGSRMASL